MCVFVFVGEGGGQRAIVKNRRLEVTSIFSITATDTVIVSYLASSANDVTTFSRCRPRKFFESRGLPN